MAAARNTASGGAGRNDRLPGSRRRVLPRLPGLRHADRGKADVLVFGYDIAEEDRRSEISNLRLEIGTEAGRHHPGLSWREREQLLSNGSRRGTRAGSAANCLSRASLRRWALRIAATWRNAWAGSTSCSGATRTSSS